MNKPSVVDGTKIQLAKAREANRALLNTVEVLRHDKDSIFDKLRASEENLKDAHQAHLQDFAHQEETIKLLKEQNEGLAKTVKMLDEEIHDLEKENSELMVELIQFKNMSFFKRLFYKEGYR